MFPYVQVGSSKGVLPEEENYLAYASNLSSCDLLSIYVYARSIEKKRQERRIQQKVSVEAESLREKIEAGRKSWAEGPLDFCIG